MTSASTNPQKAPRSKVMRFDEELQYLVDTLFTCKANLTITLRWFNIYTIRDLHRELGKDDVRRRVRFKDGDENGGEELSALGAPGRCSKAESGEPEVPPFPYTGFGKMQQSG
eukprot:scaffold16107_cov147-Skeletonema_marinoi.AAC.1